MKITEKEKKYKTNKGEESGCARNLTKVFTVLLLWVGS